MTIVKDITPDHNPISLARDMVEIAGKEDAVAGFYLIAFADGTLTFDCAGNRRADLVWALEKMKLEILNDK